MLLSGLSGLTLASINCNSLNSSSLTSINFKRKIYGVAKIATDIIFISDIRLGNRNLTTNSQEVEKLFRVNPYSSYKLIKNSSLNKRGVGFLIKNSLNFIEEGRVEDAEENFLVLRAKINGITAIIGSIYGPNVHDNLFFDNLRNAISSLGDWPIVLGGDWNCTYSNEPIASNIDCFNMLELPNTRHSQKLRNMCNVLNLVDPFRITNPLKRDYSYVPFGNTRPNRSRIDYFLITENLVEEVYECKLDLTTLSKIFDHKAVRLNFKGKGKRITKSPRIFNSILNDPDIELIVWAATAETYVRYFDPIQVSDPERQQALELIGMVKHFIRTAGPDIKYYRNEELNHNVITNRTTEIGRAIRIFRDYPVEVFHNFSLSCEDDIFMEILVNNIRNEVSSYQGFIDKFKSKIKIDSSLELQTLKSGLTNNNINRETQDRITALEIILQKISDAEIITELEKSHVFDCLNNEKMTPRFLQIAKTSGSDASLADIVKDDMSGFESEKLRVDYIADYYTNLYKKDPDELEDFTNCIENFLGPNILANPVVQNSILTENEKNSLEADFSYAELDRAVGECKKNTAGGVDGINNSFITKIHNR